MKTYRNKHFTKRDYECTNIVAIRSERLPNSLRHDDWEEADVSIVKGLTRIDIIYDSGQRYERYGYL